MVDKLERWSTPHLMPSVAGVGSTGEGRRASHSFNNVHILKKVSELTPIV